MSVESEHLVSPRKPGNGYLTLWRWHFYAALFVMPLLVVLAITGTLYCFKSQLEPLLYPHLMVVTPQTSVRLPTDQLLATAWQAVPERSMALSLQQLANADRSAEFLFSLPNGQQKSVFVNPYNGQVLGTLSVDWRFMQVMRMLHRKLLLGKPGELLMELAACWTLVMIATGVALWWPRTQNGGRMEWRPRLALTGRPLWKSLHASMGIWLAAGAVAFILTGLPWTGSWGKQFKSLAAQVNLGAPRGAWGDLPLRSRIPGAPATQAVDNVHTPMHHHHEGNDSDDMPGMVMDQMPIPLVPWAVGNVPVPNSAATGSQAVPISPDRIIAQVAAIGVVSDYTLAFPSSPDGVYVVSYFPADPKQERTIYIDQYSGAVMQDIRYGNYGAVAQAISYGTSLHMGRYFGLANQIISSLISLGLAAMAVTGAFMWWKRKPARVLGAPKRENVPPPMRGWKAGLIVLGVLFPLMGVTLLVTWALDWLFFQRSLRWAA